MRGFPCEQNCNVRVQMFDMCSEAITFRFSFAFRCGGLHRRRGHWDDGSQGGSSQRDRVDVAAATAAAAGFRHRLELHHVSGHRHDRRRRQPQGGQPLQCFRTHE